MSQTEQVPGTPEEESQPLWKGFKKFFDRITPWLVQVGIWIFGSLIAFNLLVLASLFTIGPADVAIIAATTAFAFALPLNVAGLFLLRMVTELKDAKVEDELAQAFLEEGYSGGGQIPASPLVLEAVRKRRSGIVLYFSAGMLALSIILTLAGLVATLWHMAWWIGVGFFAVVVLSILIVILAMSLSWQ